MTLKKKITEIACATSVSSASMTGCGGSDRRSSADGRTDTNQDGSVRRYFDNFTEQPCDDQGSTDGTYDDRE